MTNALSEYNEYLDIVPANSSNAKFQETSDYRLRVSEDGICLFVDAGLQVESKKASIDLVAMDSKGILFHAHVFPKQFVGKSMIVEACTIRKCVEKAIQHGWRKFHVLSDAKGVINVLKKNGQTTWDINVVCEDI